MIDHPSVASAARHVSTGLLVALLLGGFRADTAFAQGYGVLPATPPDTLAPPDSILLENIRSALTTLAGDDFEGRRTGTQGAARAAHFIASKFEEFGLAAVGNDRYFQRIPMRRAGAGDQQRIELLSGWGQFELLPAAERMIGTNVVGMIRGSDPVLRDEAVLVAAHFDHVGIGAPNAEGDSIYNGADDDASGVVAMLEIARDLSQGPPPRRTVVFLATTAEEAGLLGTQWYIQNPVVPLRRTVANLAIEMIGRPDSLAGGPGHAWLTGYRRSTMGELLSQSGLPIVPDPRPEYDFFSRSDNIAFAYLGIPAHTLSSYNLHADYHTPDDEVDRIDFEHMARVTEAAIRAVRVLADGPAPEWNPGGRPYPRRMY
ncbi:MAG TPA: M20/M25/M40 family metallo-hydrolase [Longimicrobiales bacterium]